MDDFSWINTAISGLAGILGGVIGAKITIKSNAKLQDEQLKQERALNLRKEINEEQKIINKKVLKYIEENPNSERAKIGNNVKGDNEHLSEEWLGMIENSLNHLLYENKIEISNPEQIYKMYKEFRIKTK